MALFRRPISRRSTLQGWPAAADGDRCLCAAIVVCVEKWKNFITSHNLLFLFTLHTLFDLCLHYHCCVCCRGDTEVHCAERTQSRCIRTIGQSVLRKFRHVAACQSWANSSECLFSHEIPSLYSHSLVPIPEYSQVFYLQMVSDPSLVRTI